MSEPSVKFSQRGGSWEATVRTKGKRYRRSFRERKLAIAWASQAQLDCISGLVPDMTRHKVKVNKPTLKDVYDSVFDSRWKGMKAERTHKLNALCWLDHFGCDRAIETIDEESIDCFVITCRADGNSPATINRKLSSMSVLIRHAYRRGWITRKPDIERMTEQATRINYYSVVEQKKILSAFRSHGLNHYADLFIVLCDTGIRIGEALKMPWTDIRRMPNGKPSLFIHEGRQATSPGRTIPLTDRAWDALHRQDTSQDGPFTTLTSDSCRVAWDKLRKVMGKEGMKDFVWHTCRHTFCSLLVQLGEPLVVVAELAGHKSITTTMRYAHMSPLNSQSAIDKLANLHA